MIDKTALRRAREALEKRAFQPMPPTPPGQQGGQQGGPPQGGQPPQQGGQQGGPDVQAMMQQMQDPQVQQQLSQMGIQVGPQGPTQNGQIVPPEQMAQILQQITQGGQAPQGPQGPQAPGAPAAPGQPAPGLGAPQDPPMTVGMFMQMLPMIQQQMGGQGGQKESEHHGTVTKAELAQRIDQLEAIVTQMAQSMGMSPSAMGVSPMEAGMQPQAPMAPEQQADQGLSPEALQAAGEPPPQDPGMDPGMAQGPVPPGPQPPTQMVPPQGMPVQASERPTRRASPAFRIQSLVSKLKNAR